MRLVTDRAGRPSQAEQDIRRAILEEAHLIMEELSDALSHLDACDHEQMASRYGAIQSSTQSARRLWLLTELALAQCYNSIGQVIPEDN